MYVAGRDGACPNLHFNTGALINMLTSDGLQVQDIEAGGTYHDEIHASMVMAAKRYGLNPSSSALPPPAALATTSTAKVLGCGNRKAQRLQICPTSTSATIANLPATRSSENLLRCVADSRPRCLPNTVVDDRHQTMPWAPVMPPM